jgi:UPF0755 protein
VAAALAITLVGLLLAGSWLALRGTGEQGSTGSAVQIEIRQGAGTAEVASKLQAAGVIGNATAFSVYTRIWRADGRLKSGVYDLRKGMGVPSVVDRLMAGPPVEYVTVTIPEGFVIDQIAERLSAKAGIPKAEFLALAKGGAAQFVGTHPYLADAYNGSLEGYLFPKTYRFKKGSSASEAIEMMLDQFDREIARVDVSKAQSAGLGLNQLVTLASMIERESRLDSERPLVSSVIHNRLSTDSFL